ncbi:hypothetical protein GQ55_5G040900 [Panicum hallii var. hallii]|uniref:Uncharacterized protein n=1 Tax=Panicum hallii var. hallii TaxID=1504633 RepID=A0A2T7DCI8_9POAL|nr:hypothetical protein GQ55_5G040900 [Panicum hallii var. hallii]
MMVPVFSRAAWRCAWHMVQNDLVYGWGIDFKLGYCALGDRSRNIGVVDSQFALHRGIPTLGGGGGAGPVSASASTAATDRSAVRQRSSTELQVFNRRWKEAVAEDGCWTDDGDQWLTDGSINASPSPVLPRLIHHTFAGRRRRSPPATRLGHVSHGSLNGTGAGEDRDEGGGDLRLAPQGAGQHRPHALIRAAAEICEESIPGLQVDHVDIYELRLLNTDLEVDGGFPPAVEACQARHGDLPGCPGEGGAGARNFPRRVSIAPSPGVFAGEGESESPFASPEPADHHGLRWKTTPLYAESRP